MTTTFTSSSTLTTSSAPAASTSPSAGPPSGTAGAGTKVTDADVGKILMEGAGLLHSVKFMKAPQGYGEIFSLVEASPEADRSIFHVNISAMPVSTGTLLLRDAKLPFSNLVVRSFPVGAEFEVGMEAAPAPDKPVDPPAPPVPEKPPALDPTPVKQPILSSTTKTTKK
jgi:hypothetical protein